MAAVRKKKSLIAEEEEDNESVSQAQTSTPPNFSSQNNNVRLESANFLQQQTSVNNGVKLRSAAITVPKIESRSVMSHENFAFDPTHDIDDFDNFQNKTAPPEAETYDPTAPATIKTQADEKNKEFSDNKKPENWDTFETIPPADEDETVISTWWDFLIKCLKVFAYIFTFAVVLLTSVLSKSVTLLMTSMTQPNHTISVCNSDDTYAIVKELKHDKNYLVKYEQGNVHRIAWLWTLYFSIIATYIFAFGRSLRICYFKKYKQPSLNTLLTVFTFETIHCVGLSMLCFMILPYTEVTLGAMMTNTVCTIPMIIRMFVVKKDDVKHINIKDSHILLAQNRKFTFTGLLFQFLSLVGWTIIGYLQNHPYYYLIPITLILVSSEWWENYVLQESMNEIVKFLDNARSDLVESRYYISCLILPWKIAAGAGEANMLFRNFTDSFHEKVVPIIRNKDDNFLLSDDRHQLFVIDSLWPMWFLLIHICANYVCYAFAKFTCKICIQDVSFAIPLSITVPATVSIMWAIGNLAFQDKCLNLFHPFQYIFWNVNNEKKFQYSVDSAHGWNNLIVSVIWFIGLLTQFFAILHIWKETSESLASTEQLFVSPMYNSILIDQSLTMNRRTVKEVFTGTENEKSTSISIEAGDQEQNAKEQAPEISFGNPNIRSNPIYQSNGQTPKDGFVNVDLSVENNAYLQEIVEQMTEWERIAAEEGVEVDSIDPKPNPLEDDTVRIYACATMWHEDSGEMLKMLKAVMRLDQDQAINKLSLQEFGDKSKYFELEVNIFFDDAFEQGDTDDDNDRAVNRFVIQLIEVVEEAATQVAQRNNAIEKPIIVPTPYGGKLIWKMPVGQNRLIAHVKDKNLIRHRKRWSQVMYMYYLLGYRLEARKDLSRARKNKISNNTFVLALDGDINFQPSAVHMVVDLMRKNHKLGAACGRIHPIGSGPVVWYQKFEYAIGHWLQKATEHVFGCVLCSPGCFSLFRARAVMSKSVMHKYTTKPREAIHYVQYDQGEDRWLCTLLLQQGWRIEYSAASDSYTHAPESFGEFYTQRRRWAPSTTANILDLLSNSRATIRVNESISLLYITYQFAMMLGTVLSPGTIYLMIVSAMNTALNFDTKTSFFSNLVPIILFTFVCLKFKTDSIKINMALMLSLIYSLLMLAVLVGTALDMFQQGILSPNSLFFAAMMGSFLLAAILHPQEFLCVIPLPIYMLLIPSMYLLLTIYSVTNMHIVAWGTREVKSKLSAKELAQQKLEEEARAKEAQQKKSSPFSKLIDFSQYNTGKNGLCSFNCCSGSNQDEKAALIDIKNSIFDLKSSMTDLHEHIPRGIVRRASSLRNPLTNQPPLDEKNEEEETTSEETSPEKLPNASESELLEKQVSLDAATNVQQNQVEESDKPKWITNNPHLKSLTVIKAPEKEIAFWNKMIGKYLYPLDENLNEKKRISEELIELRNKACFAFGFLNVIFVLFVFLLQIHKDVLGIQIPVSWNTTAVFDEEEEKYDFVTETTYIKMDPIGLVLVIFFGSILLVQCIGMLIHRFGTLAHLLAYTKINFLDNSDYIMNILRLDQKEKEKAERSKLFQNSGGNHDETELSKDPLNTEADEDAASSEEKHVRIEEKFKNRMEKISNSKEEFKRMSALMRKNTINALSRQQTHRQRAPSMNSDTITSAGSYQGSLIRQNSRIHSGSFMRNFSPETSSQYQTPSAPSPGVSLPMSVNGIFPVTNAGIKGENIVMRNLSKGQLGKSNSSGDNNSESTRL